MKQRIFNRGKGWYIPATNYKNQDDRAYLNVYFPNGTEPNYSPSNDQPFVFIDIDIIEQKYGAYNGKITLTVFKYQIITGDNGLTEVERQNSDFAESVRGTAYEKNFGSPANTIAPDDLPFY